MSTAAGSLLSLAGVSVRFGGLLAVDKVDLEVRAGEIRGLIGPNGAGKTSLFNAISGLVPTSQGEIMLAGTPITAAPAHVRARLGLRRTFQSIQLAPHLTVLENVLLGLHSELKENLGKTLFGLRVRASADWRAQARVREILDYLGIGALALSVAGQLSFAQQRYVELARALVAKPKLLMLDEPAAGLSPAEIEKLDGLLVRLGRETGVAIVLVEHVISLVLKISDSVTVLENGRVIAAGPPAEIAANPHVKRAYLGDTDAASH